jgi:hypothetical protein
MATVQWSCQIHELKKENFSMKTKEKGGH